MMQTPSQKKIDNSNEMKIQILSQIVALKIQELIGELGISLSRGGNKLIGRCPIHGGDNHAAFNIYPDGHTVPGFWLCRTHFCEKVFKKTIIGFVRGVLSNQKYGWVKTGDREVSFKDTIDWLCKFIGQDLNDIKVDVAEYERRKFVSNVNSLNKGKDGKSQGVTRSIVKNHLDIPAKYFIERGYSPHILSAYDVGLCDKQGREMYNRVVVPVYDKDSLMIGCTGRSIYNQCNDCKSYHGSGTVCPADEVKWMFSKWKHSKDFNTGSYLYNYWKAMKSIRDTGVVCLVEGPADLWRLEECGIHNSVAIFGCELSDEQQILLEKTGAMSVILLLDNDEPGRSAVKEMTKKLSRCYDIYSPKYSTHDVGEMNCEQIQNEIVPIIKSVCAKRQPLIF